MSEARRGSPSSKPLEIRGRAGKSPRPSSPTPSSRSHSRRTSIARLGSPVPSTSAVGTPSVKQIPTPTQVAADKNADLPSLESTPSLPAPGTSALAAAIAERRGRGSGPSTPNRPTSPPAISLGTQDKQIKSNYGSFDSRSMAGSPAPFEDPEVVKRHLVQGNAGTGRFGSSLRSSARGLVQATHDDEFSSLQLQGGDTHRGIYRWTADNENGSRRGQRSRSFNIERPQPENETLDISAIKVPGGFRRDFIRRAADSPESAGRTPMSHNDAGTSSKPQPQRPQLLTSNFLEFLTLYGHFAGEELEEDDEVLEPDEYFSSDAWEHHIDYDDQGSDREAGEDSALLTPGTPGKRRRKHKERAPRGNNTSTGAALLLLKSFVGTGVIFLSKGFLNGGMLFSSFLLLALSLISFYCFILLVNTRLKVEASFGDMGGILYGPAMRNLILSSIIISQLGFVSAYTVFVSENLQGFIEAISNCRTFIDIKYLVLMQLIIFLPLSLIRDISKLGFTALVADVFILLGLLYLCYYDIATIIDQGGVADIKAFNPASWSLMIGTAVFTFEGIGLIIPIQESMKEPKRFPGVLAMVMIIITIIFLGIPALSYAAFGSATQTAIFLNLRQDDKLVNAVQFLYSLAILLSTPLQLFPAIRIMENELFTRSGKYNPYIKWKKNAFRFLLVIFCSLVAWGGAGDLDKFVSLVGSFACVPLVYIYPPLLHLKAVATTRKHIVGDYLLIVFGTIGCVYTTVLTISSWINDAQTKTPGYCES